MVLHVLHLVGSPTNDFYSELSLLYARGCLEATADPSRYRFVIAYVTPEGQWRFPLSLSAADIAQAQPMDLPAAIRVLSEQIAAQQLDVALPQMFCLPGMTTYRSLLNVLNLPYVGNLPVQMAIATDKAKAKAIVAQAGVAVPRGECLRADQPLPNVSDLPLPGIVKPNTDDNSVGLSLVTSPVDYAAALEKAFAHSAEALVEDFIPLGREVRCGVVECDGELICLPLEEYQVNADDHPIRLPEDKLKRDEKGEMDCAAKTSDRAWIVPVDDPIVAATWAAAKKCHKALGCRHYSLFDFRIDPSGKPWFIEAGLYCSFSPKSVLVAMMTAHGIDLTDFLKQSIDRLLTENLQADHLVIQPHIEAENQASDRRQTSVSQAHSVLAPNSTQ